MKTKSIILSIVAIVIASTFTMAAEPINPKVVVVNQKESSVFKVIYAGDASRLVVLKLYNSNGDVVFTEKLNAKNGFSLPLNFSGMNFGEYTIEVNNGVTSERTTVDFERAEASKVGEPADLSAYVAKISDDRKFLLSVSNGAEERINLKIYDDEKNLIHNETMTVAGTKGIVYNLNNVTGALTFVVSSKSVAKKFQY